MKLGKMIFAVLGATMLLGALVSSASAGRLSFSTQTIRASWNRMNFTGPFGTTECGVTLGGSLHIRTMTKVVGSLIGFINQGGLPIPCIRGRATVLQATLPWHIQYDSFSGTLPNITAMRGRIIGLSLQIDEGFICLMRSSAVSPATITFNREAGGRFTNATLGGRIPTNCGLEGVLSGASSTIDPLTLTLI
jgi:hypothetical protein